jgi:hypothetical protein
VGRPVDCFAYPSGNPGDYTEETVAMVREAGFRLSVTATPGVNWLNGDTDVFRLRRLHGGNSLSSLQYALGVASLTAQERR